MTKKSENVVFCILQASEAIGAGQKNEINSLLETLQKPMVLNPNIHKAFVYGKTLVYARDFASVDNQVIYYVEGSKEKYAAYHAVYLSCALMEKKINEDLLSGVISENKIYILANSGMDRVEANKAAVVFKENGRFCGLNCSLVLIKDAKINCGSFETYIQENGEVYVSDTILGGGIHDEKDSNNGQ